MESKTSQHDFFSNFNLLIHFMKKSVLYINTFTLLDNLQSYKTFIVLSNFTMEVSWK